jgi:hypothetical protein
MLAPSIGMGPGHDQTGDETALGIRAGSSTGARIDSREL